MTDLALVWSADAWASDLLLDAGALATDEGLRTAILISLFSDARLPAGVEPPELGGDPRGWWGDAFPLVDDRDGALGSTLWVLRRAKITAAALRFARQSVQDALAWLLRDGIASAIDVQVEAQEAGGIRDRLAIAVTIDRPTGPGRQRFDFVWTATAEGLA